MPILSNVTTISDEIFKEGKFETNSTRPSSPYKARMSVDGQLFSKTVIADTKEKTSTGETNDIVCCSKFVYKNSSYSFKFLKFNKLLNCFAYHFSSHFLLAIIL